MLRLPELWGLLFTMIRMKSSSGQLRSGRTSVLFTINHNFSSGVKFCNSSGIHLPMEGEGAGGPGQGKEDRLHNS